MDSVKVGTFNYTGQDGKAYQYGLSIFTVSDANDITRRADDYNSQYTDAFEALCNQGDSHITFTEVTPSPIFL